MNHFLICLLLISGLVISCSQSSSIAGGGTDVANGKIYGQILDSAGTPISNALVKLYAYHHDPYDMSRPYNGAIAVTFTDTNGFYTIDSVTNDTFNIEALDEIKGSRAVHFSVERSGDSVEKIKNTDTIRTPGSIYVELPTVGMLAGGYICIPGTSYFHIIKDNELAKEKIKLDSVPSGIIPVLYYRNSPQSPFIVKAAHEVEVSSSGVITVEFEGTDTLEYDQYFHN